MSGFILLVIIAGAIALLIAARPDAFSVSRSAVIAAPRERLFGLVNNLRKWEIWSPWARMDPNTRYSFEGPDEGVGAAYSWSSAKTGQGTMTVTESRPHELVAMRLEFTKPFAATSHTEFSFTPEGEQTRVSWTISGRNNFMAKAMSLFMNCEKMTGTQFEQGLENLRQAAENA